MSGPTATETLSETVEFDSTKQFNFYCNISILLFGFLAILYIMRKNSRNVRDVDGYDWSKFSVSSDTKSKYKRNDKKDKSKQRVKEVPKGNGFVSDEHKFLAVVPPKDEAYLNLEESSNLQDLINFAASRMDNENKEQTVEGLYNQIVSGENSNYRTNENLDASVNDILSSTIPDKIKISQILESFGNILKKKNSNLAEITYLELVQLFIRNNYLNHASFFLCQMDRLKIKIPRRLLDLFLESNVAAKAFEKNKEPRVYSNKFDDPNLDNQDFLNYNLLRNNFTKRNDLPGLFTKLKVDAKPYVPKPKEDLVEGDKEKKFMNIDPSQVKEYIPKNYRVVKKDEQQI